MKQFVLVKKKKHVHFTCIFALQVTIQAFKYVCGGEWLSLFGSFMCE